MKLDLELISRIKSGAMTLLVGVVAGGTFLTEYRDMFSSLPEDMNTPECRLLADGLNGLNIFHYRGPKSLAIDLAMCAESTKDETARLLMDSIMCECQLETKEEALKKVFKGHGNIHD